MRVVITGAGSVGRSVARELVHNGHEVLLVDKDPQNVQSGRVPEATWLLGDACEMSVLHEAGLQDCDALVAASGDDKANLVASLLAKTEFGVPRTVARVNNPRNEWMFDETWGVDVAVSTPRLMTALVEEAVSTGDLVQIFRFRTGASMVELTLPSGSPYVGARVADVPWPADTVLTAVVRSGRPLAPGAVDVLQAGDELLIVTHADVEDHLEALLSPGARRPRTDDTLPDGEDDGGDDGAADDRGEGRRAAGTRRR